jgi:hypothetical protein
MPALSDISKKELYQALSAGFLACLLFYIPVFSTGLSSLGMFDSDAQFFYIEAVRKSLVEYGQLPMWNPWHMGGMPLMGNPQAPFSPFYLPVLLFGTVAGTKITLFALQWIGFAGMYLLARYLTLDHTGGLIAAVVWAFSGLHAIQLQGGWVLFWHLQLMPLVFLLFLIGKDDFRWLVPEAFLVALLLLGGSPYPFVITMFALGVLTIVSAISDKSLKPVVFTFTVTAVSALLSAAKIIPSAALLNAYPRDVTGIVDGFSLPVLFFSLLDHTLDLYYYTPHLFRYGHLEGRVFYMAAEFGMYIGPLALLLAVAGMFARFPYKTHFLITLAALFLLILGDNSPIPIWTFLKMFPVYDAMRVVERFRWPFILILSLLSAFGAGMLSARFKHGDLLKKAILAALFLNLYWANYHILADVFPVRAETVLNIENRSGEFFQVQRPQPYTREGWIKKGENIKPPFSVENPMLPYILSNIGVTVAYEPMEIAIFARGKGMPDYHGESFIYSAGNFMETKITDWAPNRVTVEWQKGVEGDLVLNQNMMEGWSVCDGSGLKLAPAGIVMTHISEKDSKATFCYSPRHIYVGLLISIVSFILCLVALFRVTRGNGAATSPDMLSE